MSVDHALKIIRETAKDSSRVGIPTDLGYRRPRQDWQHVVTHRQIQRCLGDGELLGKPELDEHGNWKCQMQRFGTGAVIRITDWSKIDGP